MSLSRHLDAEDDRERLRAERDSWRAAFESPVENAPAPTLVVDEDSRLARLG